MGRLTDENGALLGSMTGDGAVRATAWADFIDRRLGPISGGDADRLAVFLRQQAAEIERLTRERDEIINLLRGGEWWKLKAKLTADIADWRTLADAAQRRAEASEARNVDLLKLIADLADNLSDEGVIYSGEGLDDRRKRVADALGNDCPEWLLDHQSAAAKGGTA